jgi:S-adenosyl-L-methionine hydrolase (adenosine-forming)
MVTLTTDFGNSDYYVGALKGALLRRKPDLQLVDITHEIAPYDIVKGAFVLQQVWREFPEGSIHLIGVNCVYAPEFRFVAARHEGHFFIAPDNGILSLLLPGIPHADLRNIPADNKRHFAAKDVFVEAVLHLSVGNDFEALGEHPAPLLERISLQPVVTPARIRGTVVYVDYFDNVVINIGRDLFERTAHGRAFSLYFKRNDPITRLCDNYCDVPVGEALCLFNDADQLEIAVNMGRAAELLGLKVEDVVEVVFE